MRRYFAYAYWPDSQKNELKPHLKQTWCIGQINAEFIARMERLLWLYEQPYDPRYPVICFDERPCFLIGELVEPLSIRTGQVRKEHYAYEKNGSCALLAAIEPLRAGVSRMCDHNAPSENTRCFSKNLPRLIRRRSRFGWCKII